MVRTLNRCGEDERSCTKVPLAYLTSCSSTWLRPVHTECKRGVNVGAQDIEDGRGYASPQKKLANQCPTDFAAFTQPSSKEVAAWGDRHLQLRL